MDGKDIPELIHRKYWTDNSVSFSFLLTNTRPSYYTTDYAIDPSNFYEDPITHNHIYMFNNVQRVAPAREAAILDIIEMIREFTALDIDHKQESQRRLDGKWHGGDIRSHRIGRHL